MSEYQYIEFRAVDRPLTDKELAFAGKQSSRAEISRRRFSNEYSYSSFRGDVDGMLRRGYDIFLEYTNYGSRTIKMRLPDGLPFDQEVCAKFVDGRFLSWKKDRKTDAGILTLEPFFEELESIWDPLDDCVDETVSVRQQLMCGDLRALYVLWLCVAGDQNYDWAETIEPPVPFGLQDFGVEITELLKFFDVDPLLIQAAADDPAIKSLEAEIPTALSPSDRFNPWLKSLTAKRAKDHLEQLLLGDTASIKAELLATILGTHAAARQTKWPTIEPGRTFEELLNRSEVLREAYNVNEAQKQAGKASRAAAKVEKRRLDRMAEMVKDPGKWLAESERLVDARGTDNYKLAAEILADLKEAISGTKGATIAKTHAVHLVRKHPTLTRLKGSLRKAGVLN